MIRFKQRIPTKAWIGGIALAVFVRAVMAFYLACLFDVMLGSRGLLAQMFVPAIFLVALAEVIPALWDCVWVRLRAAGTKTAQAPGDTVLPEAGDDRAV